MAIKSYIAGGYLYNPNPSTTTHVAGGSVVLVGVTIPKRFEHTDGNGTMVVYLVDFVVDRDDVSNTVEIEFQNYAPPVEPTAGVAIAGGGPFRYKFDIPAVGSPDFKWELGTPVFAIAAEDPPWRLRVTVKRK